MPGTSFQGLSLFPGAIGMAGDVSRFRVHRNMRRLTASAPFDDNQLVLDFRMQPMYPLSVDSIDPYLGVGAMRSRLPVASLH
jgi:hypothetical protein